MRRRLLTFQFSPFSFQFNFLSEGVRCVLSQKKKKCYPEITIRVARPNFLSEGVRFGSDTKTGGWDILSVFPIRQFD